MTDRVAMAESRPLFQPPIRRHHGDLVLVGRGWELSAPPLALPRWIPAFAGMTGGWVPVVTGTTTKVGGEDAEGGPGGVIGDYETPIPIDIMWGASGSLNPQGPPCQSRLGASRARERSFLNRGPTGESMKQNNTVVTLAARPETRLASVWGYDGPNPVAGSR